MIEFSYDFVTISGRNYFSILSNLCIRFLDAVTPMGVKWMLSHNCYNINMNKNLIFMRRLVGDSYFMIKGGKSWLEIESLIFAGFIHY